RQRAASGAQNMTAPRDCYGVAGRNVFQHMQRLIRRDDPLPSFKLAEPESIVLPAFLMRAEGFHAVKRSDSGSIELIAEGERLRSSPGLDRLRTAAFAFVASHDSRVLPSDFAQRFERAGRIGTNVIVNDATIPVIGPGGGIVVHETPKGVHVDIVVRKRT